MTEGREKQQRPTPEERRKAFTHFSIVFLVFFGVHLGARTVKVPFSGSVAILISLVTIALLSGGVKRTMKSVGLVRPASFVRAAAVAIVLLLTVATIGNIVLPWLEATFPREHETSSFDYIKGNVLAYIFAVVVVAWLSAGVGEEVLFRGFLLTRLAGALGGSATASVVAVLLQAIAFGIPHFYQGLAGVISASLIALIFGFFFLFGSRNLWPLIAIHALGDTISLTSIFLEH